MTMRIIFAGTPEFARVALADIIASGHTVVAVLTQPDRPSGRGMKLLPSPVKQLAVDHGIQVLQPQTLKHPVVQEQLKNLHADLMVVAAYGLLLPQAVLDLPRLGCINIHASLLPRWRGAAPIHRAIEAGDKATGICIMQMDAGLDTGGILLSESLPILADDSCGSLHDKLAQLGGQLTVHALQRLESGLLTAMPQASSGVTYAAKVRKEEGLLNWNDDALALERRIRAFNPFPGAYCHSQGQLLKIWRAQVLGVAGTPGTLLSVSDSEIVVACGRKALKLLELQLPGGKRLSTADFLRGHALNVGDSLLSPPA